MGKKNKKNKGIDYFNMSYEEQKANADMFNDLEDGRLDITQIGDYDIPNVPSYGQSDFNKQIENHILGIEDEYDPIKDAVEMRYQKQEEESPETFVGDIHPESDKVDNSTQENGPISVVVTDNNGYNKTVATASAKDNVKSDEQISTKGCQMSGPISFLEKVPEINFRYNNDIGKMFVDDGLVSTPISVFYGMATEIDPDMIPDGSDALGSLFSNIFYYIITCKYPAVVMTEDTFEIEFSMFKKIDYNKFVFFKHNGYVFAYYIPENESDNFYKIFDDLNMDEHMRVRYVVGAALACGTIHNVFPIYDEDEISNLMEIRHDIKAYTRAIECDPETEYAGHVVGGGNAVLKNMKVINLKEFQSYVQDEIENLLYDSDDDDDYDEEPFNVGNVPDGESDEESEDDDFPDILDSKCETDDIDAMMDSMMENQEEDDMKILESIDEESSRTENNDFGSVTPDGTENNYNIPNIPKNPPTAIQPKSRVESAPNPGSMVVPIVHRRK